MLFCCGTLEVRGKYPHILYAKSSLFCFELLPRCPLTLWMSFGEGVFPAYFFSPLLLPRSGNAAGPALVPVHAQATL